MYVHNRRVFMNLHDDSDTDFLTQFDVSQRITIQKVRSRCQVFQKGERISAENSRSFEGQGHKVMGGVELSIKTTFM